MPNKYYKKRRIGAREITGPLVILENPGNVGFDELLEIEQDGQKRVGRVLEVSEEQVVCQIFEGTSNLDRESVKIHFSGEPMKLPVAEDMVGRTFDGMGRPLDEGGEIIPEKRLNVNGYPLNPEARAYPRNNIMTGVSGIDGLTTLIRGQKLPIFSGSGLPHNELATQIVNQARISREEEFNIIFAAMGIKADDATFFRKKFEEGGALNRLITFLNLADSPTVERIMTPRCALTAAEYLAFEKERHVLVIMTDMTNYCEALREISTSRGEIPSRKGYPGHMYTDLASLYERTGRVENKKGSITQIPVLTMPNDDITHPIPDLTGYITEGQIVLSRELYQKGLYPPIEVLPSLSRLMKDGIGKEQTREDHPDLFSQLYSSYSRVQRVRSLASIIGKEELSETDRSYLKYGDRFENEFLAQKEDERRDIEQTLELGWDVLRELPESELSRVTEEEIEKYWEQ